ncbi:ABC transporter permease [Phytohabitans flavus]|uniref:ABC transporter permease n=1 Tax=Phytohabitans flavus TaxID=1076124 RepID=A0A6F8XS80_9ACTN|nr:ABC transporter permease [Phytohabitans flavus]BCB76608.1 ABC transporter permease [Phytohabitans flavus]
MTGVLPDSGVEGTGAQPRSRLAAYNPLNPASRRRRKPKSIAVVLAAIWVAVLLLTAVTVQWLPLHDYTTIAGPVNLAPHLGTEFLGTDNIGRSVLSRLVFGARVSIVISFLSTLLALTIGVALGLLSVYFRGRVTRVIDIVANTVLSVPSLLLLMAIVLALRPTLVNLTCALSLIFIPTFMRLTRANALAQMSREYVIAAQAMGSGGFRLMIREVLPNSILPLLSYAVLVLPSIIVTEGSLSFLGLGVQPPTPSWGGMIAAAQATLADYPWPALMPCIVLFLTVYALNTLGDALRIKLDVREANI